MFRNILSLIIIFFILNTNNTYSQPNILKTFNNIVLHEKPKDLPNLELINKKGNTIIFTDFSSKITLINFWATWCAPCKKEMPSLDSLKSNKVLDNLEIFLDTTNIHERPARRQEFRSIREARSTNLRPVAQLVLVI